MKSLWVYYWHVNIPRWGYVEHGLEHILFYVQNHIAHLDACSGQRQAARGSRISETCLFISSLCDVFSLEMNFSVWKITDWLMEQSDKYYL